MPKIKSADLQVNKTFEGAAPDTILSIEVDPAKKLRNGEYTFQLVVTDDAGNVSDKALFTIVISDTGKPIAKITGDKVVATGKSFVLSGEASFDPEGGKITKYVWTFLSGPRTDIL